MCEETEAETEARLEAELQENIEALKTKWPEATDYNFVDDNVQIHTGCPNCKIIATISVDEFEGMTS